MVNFIGIGAQKSGTSWVYACLYEHPEICAPVKEIHFFSRPRFSEGKDWYERHFKRCDEGKICGEYSTSYLYSAVAAERIHSYYPQVKIIAIVRHPIKRALSQYGNAIKAGEISEALPFDTYVSQEKSVLEQGRYGEQLERYYKLFPKDQILTLVYEDIDKDPLRFIQGIYAFLGIDNTFVQSMLTTRVNVGRVPRAVRIDRLMHFCAEYLRKIGSNRFVWTIRKMGIPEFIRRFNTRPQSQRKEIQYNYQELSKYFTADVATLTQYVGRDMMKEWGLK